jgi:hypothetical protein
MLAQQIKEELNSFKMVCNGSIKKLNPANPLFRKWRFMSSPNPTPISSNDYAFIIWTWRLGENFRSLLCALEQQHL